MICKADAAGGGSMIHEGMFFKLCHDCMEDEEAIRLINEYMMQIDSEVESHTCTYCDDPDAIITSDTCCNGCINLAEKETSAKSPVEQSE